jgi:hypothetical protein
VHCIGSGDRRSGGAAAATKRVAAAAQAGRQEKVGLGSKRGTTKLFTGNMVLTINPPLRRAKEQSRQQQPAAPPQAAPAATPPLPLSPCQRRNADTPLGRVSVAPKRLRTAPVPAAAPPATPAGAPDAPPQHLVPLQQVCAALGSASGGRGLLSELQKLTPEAALLLLAAWAPHSRGLGASGLAVAAPAVEALLPALRHGAAGVFGRQQLADAAWGLAHFEAPRLRASSSLSSGSGSGSSGGSSRHAGDERAAGGGSARGAGDASSSAAAEGEVSSGGIQAGAGAAGGLGRWSAEFQEAMQVPFRVLPNALPGLQLAGVLEELRPVLRRDMIWLDGGARAVEVGIVWERDEEGGGGPGGPEVEAELGPCAAALRGDGTPLAGPLPLRRRRA